MAVLRNDSLNSLLTGSHATFRVAAQSSKLVVATSTATKSSSSTTARDIKITQQHFDIYIFILSHQIDNASSYVIFNELNRKKQNCLLETPWKLMITYGLFNLCKNLESVS